METSTHTPEIPPSVGPASGTEITVDNGQTLSVLRAQIREVFGRIVYSYKTHQKCADICNEQLDKLKFWTITLSALTTTSLLIAIFGDTKVCTVLGAVGATALLALTTYTKDYDLGEQAQRHVETANKLWAVREDYLSLLTDLEAGTIDISEIRRVRDALQARSATIYSSAPATNSKAYAAAQKALKVNEDMTFSDREIDLFLPTVLRVEQKKANAQP